MWITYTTVSQPLSITNAQYNYTINKKIQQSRGYCFTTT